MALQVVSPAVNVYRVTGVENGQEQTEEITFQRGELLPDWVTPYQQFVLTQTGMARQVGDFPDPSLRKVADMPAPVLMPEHSPLATLGTDVTQPMNVTTSRSSDEVTSAADPGELPAKDANKPEWEDAAVRLGMSRNKAESMRKADLMDEVTKRHEAARREAEDREVAEATLPPTFAPQGGVAQASGASSDAGGDASNGENAAKGGKA